MVVYITMIKWYNGVLRRSRTVTAKKCTKKCDVRAELLFVLMKIPFFEFLAFLSPSLLRLIYSPGEKPKVKREIKTSNVPNSLAAIRLSPLWLRTEEVFRAKASKVCVVCVDQHQ